MKLELLAPAGNVEKLKTAFYFGADACYFAGQKYGLRAYADNFTNDEIVEWVNYAHSLNKKAYITLNIIAHNEDFEGLQEYLKFLEKAKVDAVICADIGLIYYVRKTAPKLNIHVSTQANITNSQSAQFFIDMGVKRLILARELSVNEIKEISKACKGKVELECFVHGAMCISYSGRCLLSNYLTGRDSNRGACVQACRWEYSLTEKSRPNEQFPILEDNRGTYILNSKDLNMLAHLSDLIEAGVTSFKIEGRMKSPYYVATVVNAYKRALDNYEKTGKYVVTKELENELFNASHREYTTGFYYKEGKTESINIKSASAQQNSEFMAIVIEDMKDGKCLIEQRNRFAVGDILEVLSPNETYLKKIKITKMFTLDGVELEDAKNVQQRFYIETNIELKRNDILRK